jgi:hypothetical protein
MSPLQNIPRYNGPESERGRERERERKEKRERIGEWVSGQ